MVFLRQISVEDCDLIFSWRNSQSVAPFMYRDDPIPYDEHAKWIEGVVVDRPASIYRIAEIETKPMGLISLVNISARHKSCEWGGYLAPEVSRGEGKGKLILQASLEMAFVDLSMNRISVEVLETNHSAITLYSSIGFVAEGVLRERALHAAGPQDAILMSILRRDWRKTDVLQR